MQLSSPTKKSKIEFDTKIKTEPKASDLAAYTSRLTGKRVKQNLCSHFLKSPSLQYFLSKEHKKLAQTLPQIKCLHSVKILKDYILS